MSATAHLTNEPEARRKLDGAYTMRLLGENMTLTGWKWLELHDLISSITDEGQIQRARIRARLESAPEVCGRLLVGQGTDTWDPECTLPARHAGLCQP